MTRDQRPFFASGPRGLAEVLAGELRALGLTALRPVAAGVEFRGTLEDAYRVCLWSRTASRVLLPLARLQAGCADELSQEDAWELPS
jgi:23S rRNA (guanine2445-N2)-methyltransferase / 23S rRNA (guanine2069-N7)-methyltransferase